jgi:hypothetical protein
MFNLMMPATQLTLTIMSKVVRGKRKWELDEYLKIKQRAQQAGVK